MDPASTRRAYDTVAVDYARLLPDVGHESSLDLAMLTAFADLARDAALGPVADLGCGTGRVTAHLASLGLDVFGVDLSPGMVAVARERHPTLRFDVGSILDLDLPDGSCGGVLAWYSIIHTAPDLLPAVFAEFARVLAPGAPLLVGFHVGEGLRDIPRAYGHELQLAALDLRTEQVADLALRAGLVIEVQLTRAPALRDRRAQGSVLARRAAADGHRAAARGARVGRPASAGS